MRDYELVMIISPEVEEEEMLATLGKVNDFITSKGGAVNEVEHWGRRKLAYPINRFQEGNYVLDRFKLNQALTAELEANLRISEKVLRHLLVRLDNQK